MSVGIINDLLNKDSQEYFNKDELKDYEWIGKPNFLTKNRDFSILKKNDKYYLDVWNEYVGDKYLIEIKNDVSLDDFKKLVNRYVNEKLAPEFGEVSILTLHRLKMCMHKHYTSPICVNDNETGWHKKIMAYGAIKDIANFENSLLLNPALCKTIIRQMTAYYNDGEPLTSIESRYSASLIEFILRPSDNIIFVVFYYKGVDIDDIPIDVKKCMGDYGKYQIEIETD